MERITADTSRPFGDDVDANSAVVKIGSRVARYAELSRRAATGRFPNEKARAAVVTEAKQLLGIIESRIRSLSIFEPQLSEVIEAARVRQGVSFYPLPDAAPPPHDAALCKLADDAEQLKLRMGELGRRRDKAKRQMLNLEAEIAAAGAQLGDVGRAIARRRAELGR